MTLPAFELPILTVTSLTQSIKLLLEGQFRFICVQGEISNCKLQSSGHLYFSLKDAHAQVSAVMFKTDVLELKRLPKDGDHVVVKGALNVYPPSGKYQIAVRSLEWAGVGALLLKLEELREKLKGLGFFDLSRKKPLPKFPQRIGVVTSPTGAAIQDILNVLTRRFSGFHLILNPVKVQGEGSASEIAAAIDFFNRHKLVDVMIVGRGGGSIEDLWAFNEEIVAVAIFRSRIPVISAVGHESDHCLADDVADIRAPTPSAAAEMVIAEKTQQLKHIAQVQKAIKQTVFHLIRHDRERMQRVMKHPLMQSPYPFLGPKMQRLDDLRIHLDRITTHLIAKLQYKLKGMQRQKEALNPARRIIDFRERLLIFQKNLNHRIRARLESEKKHLSHIVRLLQAVDPRQILNKGYSIVISEKTHSVIHSVHSLSVKEPVKILFSDGAAEATINKTS
jgi:exodeoxyribonuclease VII large subunit